MAEDEIRSLGEISEKIIQELAETVFPLPTVPEAKPAYIGRATNHLVRVRLAAIEAYEHAKAENISQPEAAERYGSTRHTVSEAGLILENGTIEEVAVARTGEVSFTRIVRAIRSRTPADKIKGKKPSPKPPWTGHAKRAEAKQFERFRIALEWLAESPPLHELVALARASDTRSQLVNNKLTLACSYLNVFLKTWQAP